MLFSKFIFKPNSWQKTKRISLRFCWKSIEAFEKKAVSPSNCNRDTVVLSLPTRKPSVKPLSSILVNILLRTSTTMVKRKEERGSPCLKPLVALTQPLTFLVTRTAKFVKESQPLIHDLHLVLKPFLSRTWSKKLQLTWSPSVQRFLGNLYHMSECTF